MIWSARGGRGRLRRLSGRCSRSGRSESCCGLRLEELRDPPLETKDGALGGTDSGAVLLMSGTLFLLDIFQL
jgi:hypothetical protein